MGVGGEVFPDRPDRGCQESGAETGGKLEVELPPQDWTLPPAALLTGLAGGAAYFLLQVTSCLYMRISACFMGFILATDIQYYLALNCFCIWYFHLAPPPSPLRSGLSQI